MDEPQIPKYSWLQRLWTEFVELNLTIYPKIAGVKFKPKLWWKFKLCFKWVYVHLHVRVKLKQDRTEEIQAIHAFRH